MCISDMTYHAILTWTAATFLTMAEGLPVNDGFGQFFMAPSKLSQVFPMEPYPNYFSQIVDQPPQVNSQNVMWMILVLAMEGSADIRKMMPFLMMMMASDGNTSTVLPVLMMMQKLRLLSNLELPSIKTDVPETTSADAEPSCTCGVKKRLPRSTPKIVGGKPVNPVSYSNLTLHLACL